MQQRIGILGGTFNPIHYGHLAAAREVQERLNLDQVLFIPSYLPPHKQQESIPSVEERMEMVRLAIADNPRFVLSDIEMKRGGRSYTIDTITTLHQVYPEGEFFFITGLDSFLEIETWCQWERLLSLCAFVVLSRPGYRFTDLLKIHFLKGAETDMEVLDRGEINGRKVTVRNVTLYLERIPLYDISSTNIRKRTRERQSIKYLLPEAVEQYIITNKLYD